MGNRSAVIAARVGFMIFTLIKMADDPGISLLEFSQSSSSSVEELIEICVICQQSFERKTDKVQLGEKGCSTINKVSQQFSDSINAFVGNCVHRDCRDKYTNKNNVCKRVNDVKHSASPRKRRNCDQLDHSEPKCLFCETPASRLRKGSKDQRKLWPVRTLTFQQNVLMHCTKRGHSDRWAKDVKAKIEYLQDLIARDAVYHNVCYTNFRSGLEIPEIFNRTRAGKKPRLSGRPVNQSCLSAFQHVIDYLDYADVDQVTVTELVFMMKSKGEVYSNNYMKLKLKEHYGDAIVFAEKANSKDVVCLKHTASTILRDFYSKKSTDPEEQKRQLITTAARLIQSDIKSMETNKQAYPDIGGDEQQLNFLPDTLRLFLKNVCNGTDLKLAAIGQAIVQCTRPNTVLAPLQFGLGVQMHKMFASKVLINTLFQLGFSCSYTEVRKFQMNAAAQQKTDLPSMKDGQTLQFVADNVDHNAATLDGLNTFHGMGMIAVVTPGNRMKVPVRRQDVKLEEIRRIGQIGVYFYRSDWKSLSNLLFKELPDDSLTEDPTAHLETLWKISWLLKSPRPSWKGMMQFLHSGPTGYSGTSEVFFLPILDLNPTDMSCVYSTLRFVATQALKCNQIPVLTFDQPLYMKALSIISSDDAGALQSIVLRLGNFHMQMSFLGSIGALMAGSGLQQALEVVYAQNSIQAILSGKTYDRAVRAHLLCDATLHSILTAFAFKMPWLLVHHEKEQSATGVFEATNVICESDRQQDEPPRIVALSELPSTSVDHQPSLNQEGQSLDTFIEVQPTTGHKDLDDAVTFLEKDIPFDTSTEHEVKESLQRISDRLDLYKAELHKTRTSKLWLQYLDMVDVLRKAIKAERSGNFKLHLQSVKEMLPYFAASGHNHYLKCGRIYLQQMLDLERAHPEVYAQFLASQYTIRRSDRYWAGLSSDLVIEQVLMKNLKTSGGLTRGSGMGESERLIWLLSMPSCAEVNDSMQSVTGVFSAPEDHHKDAGKARQDRDHLDTLKLLEYFQARNPFDCADNRLRNIASGQEAEHSVNVDNAKQLGQLILDNMTGCSLAVIKLKKADQAVTMATKSSVSIKDEPVIVDPNLLFQRLLKVSQFTPEQIPSCFEYELTTTPASLFDTLGLPRQAKKNEVLNCIWKTTKQTSDKLSSDAHHVLDGGSLLYKQQWSRCATFNQLVAGYVDLVTRNYGHVSIVFDGYLQGPSTKDVTHLRRAGHQISADIDFDPNMQVADSRERFLANAANKQRFITLLSQALQEESMDVRHSTGDADCLIVQTVLEKATASPTVLIAQDTDLLVLLLCHIKPHHSTVCMATGDKNWNIQAVQQALVKAANDTDICNAIVFGHALGGCDTTSSLYSIGKGTIIQKLLDSSYLRELAEVFLSTTNHESIIKAGEDALVFLFSNGKHQGDLNTLRHVKYVQKLSTSTSAIEPKKLPPTSAAAQFHSMRVYLQVQEWLSLGNETTMDPLEWGWKIRDNMMFPIYTNADAAPEHLLHIVRCNCKSECATPKCSCRRHGLVCTVGCGNCKGESCMNSVKQVETAEEDEEDTE